MRRVGVRWRAALLAVITAASGLASLTPAASADVAPQAVTVGVGTSVVSGLFHTCVLMQDATVKCWGSNENGQIGESGNTGSQEAAFNPVPVTAYSPANAVSIATGGRHTCVLTSGGTVSCFGKNDFGQIGQGLGTTSSQTPTTVAGLTNVTSISAGDVFTCATRSDGTAWCWGAGGLNQLGVDPATLPFFADSNVPPVNQRYSSTPVQVTGVTDAIAVDAGDNYACALKTDGTVTCWGDNSVGQLGRGTQGGVSLAGAVPGLDRIAGLTSGRAHSCARKTSGALLCWGGNDSGQLGVGDTSPRFTPEVLPTLGSVRSVAASVDTTCAVRTTGTAACWGSNTNGQLGNGTTTNSSTPANVLSLTSAAVIAPGFRHTCALLTDGTMKCWGANDRGQMGNNTGGSTGNIPGSPVSPNVLTPQAVPNLTAVKLDAGTVITPGPTPAPVVTDQPYTSLAAPERLLDTRPGASDVLDGNASYQGIGPISTITLPIAGRGTTPSGVASVFLNVTVVGAANPGYLTVYPCDAGLPNASNLNYAANDIANAVISKLDASGRVCIFAETSVNVIVDVAGYFPSTTSFTPLAAPRRLLETRAGATPTVDGQNNGIGRRGDPTITRLAIAGRNSGEIPSSVASVALNVTAINGGGDGGYLTVWPCDAAQPNTSNVNFSTGQTIPNLVIAKVSSSGEVCIFNYKAVDLAVDAVGYFSTTISYTPLAAPARFMDTRAGGSTVDGQAAGPTVNTLDGLREYRLTIGGRAGISSSAGAVLANVTVANSLGDGYLSVYPCGQARPEVSNINYKSGQAIANSVAAGVGTNKQICIYSSTPTEVLVDVAGTLS